MQDAADQQMPLSGVTVVEHADGVAGSYAGRLLAVMGATVIKIEPPNAGSELRYERPFLGQHRHRGALFEYLNVNKQGLTLNLYTPTGRKVLSELLEAADVLIDDTAAAERTALGIAHDEVCHDYPNLVYVSVLPFGEYGPHSGYKAYELNSFHSGGEGYLTPNGLALETFPDRPPVKVYGHFAQIQGGVSAALAALAGLLARPAAGGQLIDASVQDANIALSAMAVQRYGDGVLENRASRSFRYGGVLECRDGYVELLTLEQRQWKALVELIGEPEWALDPDLDDSVQRGLRGGEINRHLRAWAREQQVDEVVRRGQELGVPLAKYLSPEEVLASEHERVRGLFAEVELNAIGAMRMLVAPFQFSEKPLRLRSGAPAPGEDNIRVFCERLGHSVEQLDLWRSVGII